ncbi:MAG: response regulator transcription factor [Sulfurimonas sp.]|nr:response regulator transcription factor [Sulfurimonas sp.]MDD3059997.1 response regulator transcription factor [Sulfurimonas sp.]MDD5203198.1 response regulator transcription factor [Sulfurimonas sp.]
MLNHTNVYWIRNRVLKKLKVLLVEDEEKLSSLLKNAIGEYFYSFHIAKDGEQGIEMFQRIAPDILITDIMMPKRTGLEMAKEIKKTHPHIPIIVLSAFSETEKFLGAIDIGVNKYFIKPFDPEELLTYIIQISQGFETTSVELAGGFLFDKTKKALYKEGRYIALTKTQKNFIQFMLQEHKENTPLIDADAIKTALWPKEDVSDEKVRTFIRRLREKTSKDLLKNIRGQGYALGIK